jgi:hypothetical protein
MHKKEENDFMSEINKACKEIRVLTRRRKLQHGDTWFETWNEELENKAPLPITERISVTTRKYTIHDSKCQLITSLTNYPFLSFTSMFYGLYFDPKIFKKGTIAKFSVGSNAEYTWPMVLNREDGFYPSCFLDFGIFPAVFNVFSAITITFDPYDYGINTFDNTSVNVLTMVNDPNFFSSGEFVNFLTFTVKVPWADWVIAHGRLGDKKEAGDLAQNGLILEWNCLDWAANRIKKAFRRLVELKKHQKSLMSQTLLELRSLPDFGVDYFDCLERWPKK